MRRISEVILRLWLAERQLLRSLLRRLADGYSDDAASAASLAKKLAADLIGLCRY
mgnify:CR=1 FL=1